MYILNPFSDNCFAENLNSLKNVSFVDVLGALSVLCEVCESIYESFIRILDNKRRLTAASESTALNAAVETSTTTELYFWIIFCNAEPTIPWH